MINTHSPDQLTTCVIGLRALLREKIKKVKVSSLFLTCSKHKVSKRQLLLKVPT